MKVSARSLCNLGFVVFDRGTKPLARLAVSPWLATRPQNFLESTGTLMIPTTEIEFHSRPIGTPDP